MSDLIKREEVLKKLNYEMKYGAIIDQCGLDTAYDIIENIPSAELKERTAKVSNQIFNNSNPYTVGAWIGTCECGELVSYSSKYCHMCGAKLDWGGNE